MGREDGRRRDLAVDKRLYHFFRPVAEGRSVSVKEPKDEATDDLDIPPYEVLINDGQPSPKKRKIS